MGFEVWDLGFGVPGKDKKDEKDIKDINFENPEPGTRNPEPGTRNPEPGTRNPEPGTRKSHQGHDLLTRYNLANTVDLNSLSANLGTEHFGVMR